MIGVFPGAAWRPVSFLTAPMRRPPLGWILHVTVMHGSPWELFERSIDTDNPRVSTGWVAKDGTCEQYLSAIVIPWAQVAGNRTYWAWETDGSPDEPLTDAQVATLARIHVWSGTQDALADSPGERGIGTHAMGGAAWGGHACPGAIRTAQRAQILAAVQAIRSERTDMPLSDADLAKIADAVENRYKVHVPNSGTLVTRDEAMTEIWRLLLAVQAAQAHA